MAAGDVGADDPIVIAAGNAVRPATEFRAVPFEAVIGMTKPTLRHTEQLIEFRIRRRHDDRLRPHPPEHRPLDYGETPGVDMLDDLHEDSAIVSADVGTRLRHRPVYQRHLRCRVAVHNLVKPGPQPMKRLPRQIDADDPFDAFLADKAGKERAIPAAEVQQCARGKGAHNLMDSRKAPFVQKRRHARPRADRSAAALTVPPLCPCRRAPDRRSA